MFSKNNRKQTSLKENMRTRLGVANSFTARETYLFSRTSISMFLNER